MLKVLLLCLLVVVARSDGCANAGGHDLSHFKDLTQKWEWATKQYVVLNLCGKINTTCGLTGQCTAPDCCAFCQLWDSDGQQDGACLGKRYDSYVPIPGGVKMKYVEGDPVPQGAGPAGPREAFLDITCDASHVWKWGRFQQADHVGSDGAYAYNLTVTTSAVCGGSGVGGGGIFLIILFAVVLPVYLIGGVLWNKFKEQKEGVEVIPNYEFWVASPGYFLAGCTFTKNKIMGLCGKSGYDTVA